MSNCYQIEVTHVVTGFSDFSEYYFKEVKPGFDILSEVFEDLQVIEMHKSEFYIDFLNSNYDRDEIEDFKTHLRSIGLVIPNEVETFRQISKMIVPLDRIYQKYRITSVVQVSTCQGCRDNILNQEGHMHPGGCLYVSKSDSDSDSESDFLSEYDSDYSLDFPSD